MAAGEEGGRGEEQEKEIENERKKEGWRQMGRSGREGEGGMKAATRRMEGWTAIRPGCCWEAASQLPQLKAKGEDEMQDEEVAARGRSPRLPKAAAPFVLRPLRIGTA